MYASFCKYLLPATFARNRSEGKCRGLTLIEILVAMGILSIILLSVYGTFFSVNRAVDATDGTMLRFREVRVFFDLIRREVEAAYLGRGIIDNRTFFRVKDRDVYGKKISELEFTAFAPYGKGLFGIRYFVEGENKVLYKNAMSLFQSGKADKIEVLDKVDEFQVEVNNGSKWIGTYDSQLTRKLPAAVRVILTFEVKGHPMTLQETMEPKLQ